MFRRGKNRAASNYWCYRRYRDYGMQSPKPIKKTFLEWIRLLKKGIKNSIKQKNDRFEWVLKFAQKSGNLVGEIQGRLFNPCKPFYAKRND